MMNHSIADAMCSEKENSRVIHDFKNLQYLLQCLVYAWPGPVESVQQKYRRLLVPDEITMRT